MAPKAKKGQPKAALSKKAEEAKKKEMLMGEGAGRQKVLESLMISGVLGSRPLCRDVRIDQVTMSLHGRELIRDTTIQLNHGRRYGLIGSNGSGKSSLLAALAARELPIPDHIDIWHLHEEAAPTEITALQAVIDVAAKEYARLEELQLQLCEEDPEGNAEILEAIGDKLDTFDPNAFEVAAASLLWGLGFSNVMMRKATKDMSGGWRMRVALAQALFKKPTLLLLDEPTNHLDLGACVWLEEYLAEYQTTIVLTSHSEDFLNGVCNEMMQLTIDQKLIYWGGNYDAYVKTRADLEVNQLKAYEKEQTDIAHLQEFIRSCGTFSNMRRQADSKQKIIDKMKEKGLTEKPQQDPQYSFVFPEAEMLAPPVCAFNNVSFSYSGKKEDYLYKNVNLGVDLDSRVALVGPNGAGKSTLLKLMLAQLEASEGEIKRHSHLRVGVFNQHSTDQLPTEKSPLEFFMEKFDTDAQTVSELGGCKSTRDAWRAKLGRFGISGDQQLRKMETMSDGLKSRVVFALISQSNPHVLLLDEPTNHLDMQCIDALAKAINSFNGGLVLVSHDFRLIEQVAQTIWVCDGGISVWKGDIKSYKRHLSKEMKESSQADVRKKHETGGTTTKPVVEKKLEKPPAVERTISPEPAAVPKPISQERLVGENNPKSPEKPADKPVEADAATTPEKPDEKPLDRTERAARKADDETPTEPDAKDAKASAEQTVDEPEEQSAEKPVARPKRAERKPREPVDPANLPPWLRGRK